MVLNGTRLREARKAKGLSRPQVFLLTGASVDTIKRAEQGRPPSAVTLAKIADALGVDMESLFDKDGAAA